MLKVPNKFPTVDSPHRLALIGETPGADELTAGEPFVGTSGRFLASCLSTAGLPISCCFKGNICQIRPPDDKISLFKWDGEEIQSGIAQLKFDLNQYKPNIIVCLGNIPLKAFKDPNNPHPLIPKLFKYKNSKWRGSLFLSTVDDINQKCISTYHPAYCLRDFKAVPLLRFDLKRAIQESLTSELILPKRLLLTTPTYEDIITNLSNILRDLPTVALDIEGGINSMSCISFATTSHIAFIVPFVRKNGSSIWSEEQERIIWRLLAEVLEHSKIPKILQNSLYDTFVLQWSYHVRVRNVVDDTMLKHWSLYAELKKSLALQTSIYTREPYYKFLRLQHEEEETEKETE